MTIRIKATLRIEPGRTLPAEQLALITEMIRGKIETPGICIPEGGNPVPDYGKGPWFSVILDQFTWEQMK